MKLNPTSSRKSDWLWTLALLAGVLGLLFWRSFLPSAVHFSNDGPLGAQQSDWARLPQAISGMWDDLNSLGLNCGSWAPNLNGLIRWGLGPLGFAKFLAPVALCILGLGAWTFFRSLGFAPVACTLGALAAALNSNFFSAACWGVAAQEMAMGMCFIALALVQSNRPSLSPFARFVRLALAGLVVGVNVMDAADIGAIFSMLVAAAVVCYALLREGSLGARLGRGIGQVIVIALFAGFIATQTVTSLVSTQIMGIAGTQQDEQSKAQHWDWATQWSAPKSEGLSFIVPGLFGYRMDTPDGGNYWGAVGRDPNWDRWFAGGQQGTPPPGFMRFTGGGFYAGVLVVLVALWTVAQSLRQTGSVFSDANRKAIWFWAVVAALALLLGFGRHAPFYALLYKLPYFSTIRNPIKFFYVVNWALVVLFAYGIQGLNRRYLETPLLATGGLVATLQSWWGRVRGFDRQWTFGCLAALALAALACMVYASSRNNFVAYLQTVQFDEAMANAIASFSLREAWLSLARFALALGAVTLVLSGYFAGRRARWGAVALGAILVCDLAQADLPWIQHWDWQQKYATNPVIDFLKQKPYEQRVAGLPFRMPPKLGLLEQLYRIEWAQHHFPYYNIQSLDIVQMPRMPEDLTAWEKTLGSAGAPGLLRRWELSNTRYLLGPAMFVEVLNQQLDPQRQRFKDVLRFEVEPKPGIRIEEARKLEEFTAVPATNGSYALIEFTGALPRASLFANWQVVTNGEKALALLADASFDPHRTVLVDTNLSLVPAANATNQSSGTVEYVGKYTPAHFVLKTAAQTPTVLLVNDRYDPMWKVTVDGQPAPLLRCNFLMRGVALAPGTHTVEFHFQAPNGSLYVTLAGFGLGVVLLGLLVVTRPKGPDVPAA